LAQRKVLGGQEGSEILDGGGEADRHGAATPRKKLMMPVARGEAKGRRPTLEALDQALTDARRLFCLLGWVFQRVS
jgi:hypothetical protein